MAVFRKARHVYPTFIVHVLGDLQGFIPELSTRAETQEDMKCPLLKQGVHHHSVHPFTRHPYVYDHGHDIFIARSPTEVNGKSTEITKRSRDAWATMFVHYLLMALRISSWSRQSCTWFDTAEMEVECPGRG